MNNITQWAIIHNIEIIFWKLLEKSNRPIGQWKRTHTKVQKAIHRKGNTNVKDIRRY